MLSDCRSVAVDADYQTVVGTKGVMELVTLRLLTTDSLVRWSLIPLLKTLLGIGTQVGVASKILPLQPPLLGFHLFALIVNHNSAVHQ